VAKPLRGCGVGSVFTAMKTLLIAEDDPHIRLLVDFALEGSGVRIEQFIDGAALLDRLAQTPIPDLVVLDINLPRADGFDVLQRLKSDPRLRAVPVLMLSASALDSSQERARRLGAARFLAKPFDVHRFTEVVGELLNDAQRDGAD
jgi:CheY-like chemotaxis protein